jgi:amino acid efflux transporter
MLPTRERPGLTRRQAVPLAVGSVAGSGILFLPSAVYAEAGSVSLLVWLLATGMCLPMLLMFDDMVRANPGGDGIEAFIRAGLGDRVARCVPPVFLGLVVLGLPSGAMVAGEYVAGALGAGRAVAIAGAAAVLVAAVAANLAGARTSARVQHAGVAALLATAVVLVVAAVPGMADGLGAVRPRTADLGPLLPAATLAFWAFAGFENLTFLSREFRDPRRDFLPVSATALGAYGLLTVLLTVAIAVRVPRGEVDEVTGLLQLADTVEPRALVVGAVAAIAVGAMTLNAVAWVWGVSRLVATAATRGALPTALAPPAAGDAGDPVPRRAIGLLAALFAVSGTVLALAPGLVVDAVAAAGATFVVLYLLAIVSYARARGVTFRSATNLALLAVLAVALVQSGARGLYGPALFAVAFAAQPLIRGHQARTEATAATAGPARG